MIRVGDGAEREHKLTRINTTSRDEDSWRRWWQHSPSKPVQRAYHDGAGLENGQRVTCQRREVTYQRRRRAMWGEAWKGAQRSSACSQSREKRMSENVREKSAYSDARQEGSRHAVGLPPL